MATMPSLLLVIFLLQLTIHLLNTVWSTKFGELVRHSVIHQDMRISLLTVFPAMGSLQQVSHLDLLILQASQPFTARSSPAQARSGLDECARPICKMGKAAAPVRQDKERV